MADLLSEPGVAFYSTLENATSGLVGTVGVRVINKATNATAIARTTSGIVEAPASSGTYVATITAPVAGRYLVLWDTGSVSPSTTASDDLVVSSQVSGGIPAIDATGLAADIIAALDPTDIADAIVASLGAGTDIVFASPVDSDGDVEFVIADDYNAADGRAWEWTNAAGTWPDLNSATITLTVKDARDGSTILTKTGSVITPVGLNQKVRVEPATGDTDNFTAGRHYRFALKATLSGSSRVVTLQRGTAEALGNPL